jgi:hypothetical protein
MALEAAEAWQPGGQLFNVNCGCQAWLSADGSQCGQWCASDYLPGRGAVGDSTTCGRCLDTTIDSTFTWN